MTEVIVLCDRKRIFIKSGLCCTLYLFLQVLALSISVSFVDASTLELKPLLDSSSSNGFKFSSILLTNSPLKKPLTVPVDSVIHPTVSVNAKSSEPNKTSSADPETSGDSLWGVIKKSFFKNKAQLPNLSQNSVFASPSLKSPRQAWEDLVTNAKSGFKYRYSPFQTVSETPSKKDGETPKSKSDDEKNLRTPRGSLGWSLDPSALAWDTAKIIWGVNKDIASHVWNKHVVTQTVPSYSPIKTALFKPLSDYYDLKTGVAQIYKDKIKDLAYLNFVHKETKANDFKSLFNPLGFAKPSIFGSASGWSQPQVQVQVQPDPIVTQKPVSVVTQTVPAPVAHALVVDLSFVKLWINAVIKLKKKLLLTHFKIKAELLTSLPALVNLHVKLLYAVLLLIAKKDWYAVHHILHILNTAVWKGKDAFFRVVLQDKPFSYKPLYDKYGPQPLLVFNTGLPYGAELTTTEAPVSSSYGVPPAQNHQGYSGPDLTSQYGVPAEPTVSTNPLYSYPSFSSSGKEAKQEPQYSYATLPPVVTNSYGRPETTKFEDIPSYVVSKWTSTVPQNTYGSGSEKSTQQSGFLSKLVQSFGASLEETTKDKRKSEPSETKADGASRFSLKLLGSGFSSS